VNPANSVAKRIARNHAPKWFYVTNPDVNTNDPGKINTVNYTNCRFSSMKRWNLGKKCVITIPEDVGNNSIRIIDIPNVRIVWKKTEKKIMKGGIK